MSGFREKIEREISERKINPNKAENDNQSTETVTEGEKFEHSEFFGIENIRNYPACLDLRLSDGNSKALPYSFITEIDFNASEGIEIIATTKKISITGRNLNLLYNYLVAFRVKYIKSNVGKDLGEEKSLFVKAITIEEV